MYAIFTIVKLERGANMIDIIVLNRTPKGVINLREMKYKEKYERGLECIQEILSGGADLIRISTLRKRLQPFFPELKESEDERMFREIKRYIKEQGDKPTGLPNGTVAVSDMLAWLEKQDTNKEYVFKPVAGTMIENAVEQALKQGDVVLAFNGFYTPVKGKTSDEILMEYDRWLENQAEQSTDKIEPNAYWSEKDKNLLNRLIGVLDGTNEEDYHEAWEETFLPWLKSIKERMQPQPTDKIEPKFKVGDWVLNNVCFPMQIVSIKDGMYIFTEGDAISVSFVDENYHLWTIQDAEDGDVLANDHHILILKELDYDWYSNGVPYSVHAYCGIKPNGNFELGKENWCFCGTLHMRPATSEQRDLLFEKMKEAGYEWDAERKELKKPQKIIDNKD